MNTQQIIEKHCSKNKNHVHHPFIFYCLYCKFQTYCYTCQTYEHNFCYSCNRYLPQNLKDDAIAAHNLGLLLKCPSLIMDSDRMFMSKKYFSDNTNEKDDY